MTKQEFYRENQARIENAFAEYISYMQDSMEHINFVANDNDCFWEFVERMMDEEENEEKIKG